MEKDSEDSQVPLLDEKSESNNMSPTVACHCRNASTPIRPWTKGILFATFSLLAYIAVLLTIVVATGSIHQLSKEQFQPMRDRFTLPRDLLEFEERQGWYPLQFPWNQGPSDALDKIWGDMLYALNIRIKKEEVEFLGLNTTNRVQLNGGDYLGVIGGYHHLHCLNNMRIAIHWDYYKDKYGNFSRQEVFSREHSDHCIDTLRQALMCHANAEVHTAEWLDRAHELGDKELSGQSTTTCLKWESLDKWARPRALRAGEYSFRPGPYYGKVYDHQGPNTE
ncbi:uncharacterized protein GGS22DRAFT_47992 [Annulohypoxylon maeteangense]|uniref:uncharacterized protein n=1 Tax=Annulohypoxylon maeteangense TaxID=1927788 RepID=UPI002007D18B|nr:uncharacterized protein GGS22DRAFT_47992 [Annulohypoxylon maeteangense]KAI0882121.1 hypothetical protein GGS22DRAFT_47992 [Annulohypoxylon maeteangense]